MSEVIVRPIQSGDVDKVVEMGMMLAEFHCALDPERYIGKEENSSEGYKGWLTSAIWDEEDVFVLVAEIDGEIVGYVLGVMTEMDYDTYLGKNCEMSERFVLPAFRKMGIGAKLAVEFYEECKRRGFRKVIRRISVRNFRNRVLAVRDGFRETTVEMMKLL